MPLQTAERALLDERRHLTRTKRSPSRTSRSTSCRRSSRSPTRCGWRGAAPRSSSRASSTPSRARAPRTARSARSRCASTPASTSTPFLDIDEILDAAHATRDAGATQFCIVVAVRGPEERLLRQVIDAVDAVQRETGLEVACSLGLLQRGAGRTARGRGRAPLQPQPRGVPRAVPVDLHDAQLRRPRRDRSARRATPAWSCAAAASSAWARRSSSASTSRSSSPSSSRARCRSTCSTRGPARRSTTTTTLSPREALQAIALFRLILPGAWLRLAGGRERVLGELQAHGPARRRQRADRRQLPHDDRPRRPRKTTRCSRRSGMPVADGPGRRPLRRRRHGRPRPARRAASIPRHRRSRTAGARLVVRREVGRSVAAARRRGSPTRGRGACARSPRSSTPSAQHTAALIGETWLTATTSSSATHARAELGDARVSPRRVTRRRAARTTGRRATRPIRPGVMSRERRARPTRRSRARRAGRRSRP